MDELERICFAEGWFRSSSAQLLFGGVSPAQESAGGMRGGFDFRYLIR